MNREEAIGFMFPYAQQRWNAGCGLYVPAAPRAVRFQDVPQPEPETNNYWVRIGIRTDDEQQETLRMSTRRFKTTGELYMQLFGPVTDGKVGRNLSKLADYIRDGFRAVCLSDHLDFVSARIVDNLKAEPAWLQVQVRAGFQYRQFI